MSGTSINEVKCNNMMNALKAFASKTEATCEKLNAAILQCQQVRGENDVVIQGLTGDRKALINQYKEAAVMAKSIASNIQIDLDYIAEARRIANQQLDGSSDY